MSSFVSEIKCSNPACGAWVKGCQEGIQYANLKYFVTCPSCGHTTTFSGQASLKFHGDLAGYVEVREVPKTEV
ncbi:MAG: hypothetical protein A2600_11260 [Candidatus Lambdaproteobacteria bacterium RIFOXYD1_FULL_56_27]|uniref:Uncharacterized protein n=1 Tax=Candidatus Lambdaproteobacteria bacterium RIFOXYD2_FULL_56_26 TaxID=1817773 RepID=A0A1F6GZH8_9PROT|nr:MAG: hypothetical protein A2426_08465 [Candidatus Lambdaproteobacteria bacterium RIFOXYC1_FULL_56_13]OGH03548.1 MAG: hypothetical protein A2557_01185 [Candidatus Lambdaproteobacteria bacterium RIFOXYD2_FULL_56_26]OGH07666.1 MAG: hypothetical protein A2600_11260 [Candidatus Lambdaproteobacteria bacterium RIFOXYD1_FULL_56_27]